jgi:hypothetical protein
MYRGNNDDDAFGIGHTASTGSAFLQWEITHAKVRQLLDRAAELLASVRHAEEPVQLAVVKKEEKSLPVAPVKNEEKHLHVIAVEENEFPTKKVA